MYLPLSLAFLLLISAVFASYESDHLLGKFGFTYNGDEYYKVCGAELIQWAQDVCDNCQSEMDEHEPVLEVTQERQYFMDHKKIAELCCDRQCSRRHIREMCCF